MEKIPPTHFIKNFEEVVNSMETSGIYITLNIRDLLFGLGTKSIYCEELKCNYAGCVMHIG
jgi:hypothetical protein